MPNDEFDRGLEMQKRSLVIGVRSGCQQVTWRPANSRSRPRWATV